MGRPPTTRACDRCHAVKEKCRRIPGQSACERCHRLQNTCQSLRPVGTAGRKPHHHRNNGSANSPHVRRARSESSAVALAPAPIVTEATTPTSPESDIVSIPRSPSPFDTLSDREMFIVKCISQGRPRIDQFLVAPSFRVNHHKTFARHLHNAPPWIHDALIATAALLACEYDRDPAYEDMTIGHRRAASAISTLRSIKSIDLGDLSAILLLAVSAVTFSLHISGSSLAICRHALITTKPTYESIPKLDSECLAFFICLILSETEECFVRGEVPTIRFRPELAEGSVDRYVGIASPMLPYLHDICKIGFMLRQKERPSDAEIMRSLGAIESATHEWIPTLPEGCAARFLKEEMVSLLSQANTYRCCVLLLVHRLRYPYGTELATGTALSDAILKELRSVHRHTKRSVSNVIIPFMAACFELTDPNDRQTALGEVDIFIEFSKKLRIRIKDQFSAFWTIKDIQGQVHWCDVVTWLPQ